MNAVELALTPEAHHIKHRAKGGGNEPENLVTLLHYKHRGKAHEGKGRGLLFLSLIPLYYTHFNNTRFIKNIENDIIHLLIQRDVEMSIKTLKEYIDHSTQGYFFGYLSMRIAYEFMYRIDYLDRDYLIGYS